MTLETAPARAPRRGRVAGFTLVEVAVAMVILVVAVLGHVATIWTAHQNAQATERYGLAVQTLERFVERLREDPDWDTLWVRLQARTAESAGDTALASLSGDPTLPGIVATTYYPTFIVPREIQNARFLVQVPAVRNASGAWELREDLNAPRYGLPWDLNGDGLIDATPRNTDYRQLPVVVRIRWGSTGLTPTEIVLSTWLRGDR